MKCLTPFCLSVPLFKDVFSFSFENVSLTFVYIFKQCLWNYIMKCSIHGKGCKERACAVKNNIWMEAQHKGSLTPLKEPQSWLKLMSIELVMPSNHLILCCPLLLLPSVFLSIRVFSNESVLCIRWAKYWSFSINPPNKCSGLISFRIYWIDLLAVQGLSRVFSNTIVQKHQFFGAQPSL